MAEDLSFEIRFLEGLLQRDETDTVVIEVLASYYTRAGRIEDGLKLDERHASLEPDNPTAHYNLACSLALKNEKDKALESLQLALNKGFDDLQWMLKDPDLKSLQNEVEFLRLLQQYKKSRKSPI